MSDRTMLRLITGKPAEPAVVLPAVDPFSEALNPDALCPPEPDVEDKRLQAFINLDETAEMARQLRLARNPSIRAIHANRLRCRLVGAEMFLAEERHYMFMAIDWMDCCINGSEEGTAILQSIVNFRTWCDTVDAREQEVLLIRRELCRHEYRAILSKSLLNRRLRAINVDDVR